LVRAELEVAEKKETLSLEKLSRAPFALRKKKNRSGGPQSVSLDHQLGKKQKEAGETTDRKKKKWNSALPISPEGRDSQSLVWRGKKKETSASTASRIAWEEVVAQEKKTRKHARKKKVCAAPLKD